VEVNDFRSPFAHKPKERFRGAALEPRCAEPLDDPQAILNESARTPAIEISRRCDG
jgi:hypothetical protein